MKIPRCLLALLASFGASSAASSQAGETWATNASREEFTVALIPTTLSHTTLGFRQPGDTVNLEVDVVAKYVERLTAGYSGNPSAHEEAGAL